VYKSKVNNEHSKKTERKTEKIDATSQTNSQKNSSTLKPTKMKTHKQYKRNKKQNPMDMAKGIDNLDSMDNPIHAYESNLSKTAAACVDKSIKLFLIMI
jgi:hypothetical protein